MKGFLSFLKVIVWIVYALTVLALVVLGFAFVLLLLDANPDAGFSQLVAGVAAPFFAPFEGLIEPTKLGDNGIISWSILIAMLTYAVLGAFIASALNWVQRRLWTEEHPAGGANLRQQPPQSTPAAPVAQQPVPQPPAAQPAPQPTPQPAAPEPPVAQPAPYARPDVSETAPNAPAPEQPATPDSTPQTPPSGTTSPPSS